MAALELRNKTYRVVFMYGGKKHAYSLDTGERDIAEGLRGGVERTLMLLEQQALTLPKGTDIIEFVKKGGREAPKPEPVRERIQLGSLRDGYLQALGNGSIEENSLATVRMHLNHFADQTRLPSPEIGPPAACVGVAVRHARRQTGTGGKSSVRNTNRNLPFRLPHELV